MVMEGTASFLGQLAVIPWDAQAVYFGDERLVLNARMLRAPCINFMADADLYQRALQQAAAFVDALNVPCFNHPRAVLRTTRDSIHDLLQDIPGLHVPRTVRANAATLAQLQDAVERAGISYPVLVRMCGDHGGATTALVKDAAGWDAVNPLPWGGRDVYLTQFVDYRDPDGHYRKTRIVVVGDGIFARHLIVADDWMVHAKNRLPGSRAEEQAYMENFATGTLPRIAGAVQQIAQRIGLDYFGIDACIRPDGSLLLFEANACMNSLDNTLLEDPYVWDQAVESMTAHLATTLADSTGWRTSDRAPAP
jgi:glutathione synthase/RimK-type ligase-like ATP-grasp enzyme